jgi:hypothetical protein
MKKPTVHHTLAIRRAAVEGLVMILALSTLRSSHAQEPLVRLLVSDEQLKRMADGALTLMAFTVLPDVNTSSLTIKDAAGIDNPGISQTTLGGGFTVSRKFPLYLEGTLGYSRFDPKIISSDGLERHRIPRKWNSFAATGGIGWDLWKAFHNAHFRTLSLPQQTSEPQTCSVKRQGSLIMVGTRPSRTWSGRRGSTPPRSCCACRTARGSMLPTGRATRS